MNSRINVNRSHDVRQPTGPSNTPTTASPTGRRTAPTTSTPLQTRGGTLPEGNMAPRAGLLSAGPGPTPPRGFVKNSFANAVRHAQGAIHDWGQGVHHRMQQHANGFAAHQAQANAAWYPNAGGYAAANGYRLHQNYHNYAANQAHASAANHADAFFGHAAQGIKHGARQAAYKTASMIERFDPGRLASQAARYGGKVLNKAGKVASAGVTGLMLGGAVAYGVGNAVHHAQHMAHASMPHVAGIVGGLVAGPLLAPALVPVLGHAVGHFAGHAVGHVAGHTGYHALGHRVSAFCHGVARFNPFHLAHGYRPLR